MLRRNVMNTHNVEFTSKCSMWLYLFKSTIRKVVLPTNIKKRVRGEKVSILLRIFFISVQEMKEFHLIPSKPYLFSAKLKTMLRLTFHAVFLLKV